MAITGTQDPTSKSANVRMDGAVSTAMVRSSHIYLEANPIYSFSVCQNDNACHGFPLGDLHVPEEEAQNMTCYTGGKVVNRNFQMCDVTSTGTNDLVPVILLDTLL